jgi:hypothetical protein
MLVHALESMARLRLEGDIRMNKRSAVLVASLLAGGAIAQSSGSGSGATNGGDSTQAPVTGGGATTGGALGASGGAIVEPGSTPATRGMGSRSSGTGAMGAGPAAPSSAPVNSTTPTGHSDECPVGTRKQGDGCVVPDKAMQQDRARTQ